MTETFTNSIFFGRVLPIAYFIIVIPVVLFFIYKVVTTFWRYFRNRRLTKKNYFTLITRLELLFLIFLLLSCYITINIPLSNITAQASVTNDRVSYQEYNLSTNFSLEKVSENVDIKDIIFICKNDRIFNRQFTSFIDYDWTIAGYNAQKNVWSFVSIRKIDSMPKVIQSVVKKRPDLKKDPDSSCYFKP